jgi:cell division protein FtsA
MNKDSLILFLEINNLNYIFFVGKNDEENNFQIIFKQEVPLAGIEDDKISSLEKVFSTIKQNLYLIEQKLEHTFNEIVLILDYFNLTFLNLTGYKKLNNSQVLRENIIYILNTLKSCVVETEKKKNILHIFNSKFYLDKKKIENLPVGLFGDFYSHELSFVLINKNDYSNLENVLDKCGLQIKKILVKSFISGALTSNNNKNLDTFFYLKINENNSKLFYYENNCIKSEQNFKFGADIVIKDISKITYLNFDTIKMILKQMEFKENIKEDELIDKFFFRKIDYRKIKKKLIYDIALARIEEMIKIILFKNINYVNYNKISKNIFFEIDDRVTSNFLEKIFKMEISNRDSFKVNLIKNTSYDCMLQTAYEIVHFGWKKEAIPIIQPKISLTKRFFEAIFG